MANAVHSEDPAIFGTALQHSQLPFVTQKIGRVLTASTPVTAQQLWMAHRSQAHEARLPMVEIELAIGAPKVTSGLVHHMYPQFLTMNF